PTPVEQPRIVEAPDPTAGIYTGLAVAGMLLALVFSAVVLSSMPGNVMPFVTAMEEQVLVVIGGMVLVLAVGAIVGWAVGKQNTQGAGRAG
ncbi:MAG: hypothetical protein ACOC93_03490, partial [Planctomycetota bacterium]